MSKVSKPAKLKDSLNKLQRNLFEYMKKKAMSYESEPSKDLVKYTQDQKKYSKRDFKLSDLSELLKSIEKSDVVYLGDFHTFDQSSRNMERILRTLINTNKKNLSLGVEFVHQHKQKYIDQYLNNFITEHEFLESVEYHESWHFPWNHYRFFFQMAKKHNLKIIALNSVGQLSERDKKAAMTIEQHFDDNPQSTLLVLFGELHIVPNKLPEMVQEKKPILVQTIIHQNLDEVFWKLKENQRENQVVKYNDLEFSIQSSPPWVKYESMIYWYENLLEDPEFEIHEYVMDSGLMTFNSTVFDTFNYITEKLASTYSLEISTDELEDFNLYDHTKMDYLLSQIEELPLKVDRELYKKLITTGRSFKLPGRRVYYCPNYSINRIAFLAGLHIQDVYFEKANPSYNYDETKKKDSSTEMIRMIYELTIGYFSSKVINPYRKCNLYQDLLKEAQTKSTEEDRRKDIQIALEVIDRQASKDEYLIDVTKGLTRIQLYRSARITGYFFGDVLYDNFYEKENKELESLLRVIFEHPDDEIKFDHFKWALLPLNEYKNYKKRFF